MNKELNMDTIRQKCISGNIKWTTHVQERIQERNIQPSDIIYCIKNGKIIEQYPEAYPYPACLILGETINGIYIHIVVGYGEGFIWIVTVYEPDENSWSNGFSIRKG